MFAMKNFKNPVILRRVMESYYLYHVVFSFTKYESNSGLSDAVESVNLWRVPNQTAGWNLPFTVVNVRETDSKKGPENLGARWSVMSKIHQNSCDMVFYTSDLWWAFRMQQHLQLESWLLQIGTAYILLSPHVESGMFSPSQLHYRIISGNL